MEKKYLIIISCAFLMFVLIFVCLRKGNNSSDSANISTQPKLTLTNSSKALLESYCYYIDSFSSTKDINNDFLHNFIFNTYTTSNQNNYNLETITFDSIGSLSMFKIPKIDVKDNFYLIFGYTMPIYEPDKTETDSSLFFKDGFYYVSQSEYSDHYYQYSSFETDGTNGTVLLNKISSDSTTNVTIKIRVSDNSNGFIITSLQKE